MKDKIILLGGGGHAKVLIDLIMIDGRYEIIGILDSQPKIRSLVKDIPVLGDDDLLADLYKKGVNKACIGIGSVKDNTRRKRLYERVKQYNFSVPCLIHPSAIMSENAKVSEGVQIMAGVVIQTDCMIGENTIINTGAIVEHDCSIGKHVHICPGVIISGGVSICDNAFVGVGATIIHGIKIGEGVLIGAGSVVVNDVSDGMTVMGVPARMVNE